MFLGQVKMTARVCLDFQLFAFGAIQNMTFDAVENKSSINSG